jgi:hypothetical protein
MTTKVFVRVGQPAHDDVMVTTVDREGHSFGLPIQLGEGEEAELYVHSNQRLVLTEVPKRAHAG